MHSDVRLISLWTVPSVRLISQAVLRVLSWWLEDGCGPNLLSQRCVSPPQQRRTLSVRNNLSHPIQRKMEPVSSSAAPSAAFGFTRVSTHIAKLDHKYNAVLICYRNVISHETATVIYSLAPAFSSIVSFYPGCYGVDPASVSKEWKCARCKANAMTEVCKFSGVDLHGSTWILTEIPDDSLWFAASSYSNKIFCVVGLDNSLITCCFCRIAVYVR